MIIIIQLIVMKIVCYLNMFITSHADGGIIKKDIQQYFDEDRLFLADRYIKGTCPKCGAEDQYGDACENVINVPATDLIDPVSVLSGQPMF